MRQVLGRHRTKIGDHIEHLADHQEQLKVLEGALTEHRKNLAQIKQMVTDHGAQRSEQQPGTSDEAGPQEAANFSERLAQEEDVLAAVEELYEETNSCVSKAVDSRRAMYIGGRCDCMCDRC
jgi:chromosome segregation ATPase